MLCHSPSYRTLHPPVIEQQPAGDATTGLPPAAGVPAQPPAPDKSLSMSCHTRLYNWLGDRLAQSCTGANRSGQAADWTPCEKPFVIACETADKRDCAAVKAPASGPKSCAEAGTSCAHGLKCGGWD